MAKTVTKSDYEDGSRGYYTLIADKEVLAKGLHNLNNKFAAKIKLIIIAMEEDRYMPQKFYIHYLKDGSYKVYGVGLEIPKEVFKGGKQ